MASQPTSGSGTPRVIVGELPRPRALALGFNEREAAFLYGAFPTVRAVSDLSQVAQIEWDVLVTKHGATGADPHLFVLGVADVSGNEALPVGRSSRNFGWAEDEKRAISVQYDEVTHAQQFEIPAGLPAMLHRLVVEQLAPAASARPFQLVLHGTGAPTVWGAVPDTSLIHPFLRTSEGTIIAGSFRRRGGIADCWCLPGYLTDLVAWALAARTEWEVLAPERFPRPAPWMRRDEWRTPAELDLFARRASLEGERTRYLATLKGQLHNVDAFLATATDAADAHERKLLTAQGDALKAVVAEALRALGFLVDDMDPTWPAGDHREDLRLRVPDNAAWLSLVEVRGYRRGAQLADLMRLQRFGSRYQQEAGRMPDRLWFVANHDVAQDPSERMPALASNPNEVQTFAESGGLVIDTVELFKIWHAIEAGTVDPASARLVLMEAAGRFTASSIAVSTSVARTGRPTK